MKRPHLYQTTTFLVAIVACFFSCSKSGSNPAPKNTGPSVTISSLSVNTGPYSTRVTLTGTGFSTTANNDKIFFNGKSADVTVVSSTQLITTVPLAAGTGNVTVTVNGTTATGPLFTYQQAQVVTTFVVEGQADGMGTVKGNFQPNGIAVDGTGNIYVADKSNFIRKITPVGLVSTIAGSGKSGTDNGTGAAATFSQPSAIAIDAAGNIFVADFIGLLIRKITTAGVVSTFAGNKISTGANGTGTAASFGNITGMVFNSSGNLIVSDQGLGQIRQITPDAVVTTMHSNNYGVYGLTMDKAGNIFEADQDDNSVNKITASGTFSVFAGGSFLGNNLDGLGTAAQFNSPYRIAIDLNGNLFVIDSDQTIREVTPDAVVTTFSGNRESSFDGPVATATFLLMQGIAIDGANNIIYVADQGAIRKISVQ